MALFSFRQAELFFLGGAAAPPAPLGRSPVAIGTWNNGNQWSYYDRMEIINYSSSYELWTFIFAENIV